MSNPSLEKYVDGEWIPFSVRYLKVTADQKRNLNLGHVVKIESENYRREDYKKRSTLFRKLSINI